MFCIHQVDFKLSMHLCAQRMGLPAGIKDWIVTLVVKRLFSIHKVPVFWVCPCVNKHTHLQVTGCKSLPALNNNTHHLFLSYRCTDSFLLIPTATMSILMNFCSRQSVTSMSIKLPCSPSPPLSSLIRQSAAFCHRGVPWQPQGEDLHSAGIHCSTPTSLVLFWNKSVKCIEEENHECT